MTFVPFRIPHGVLSRFLLPLRTLGAVSRDVFLDYVLGVGLPGSWTARGGAK